MSMTWFASSRVGKATPSSPANDSSGESVPLVRITLCVLAASGANTTAGDMVHRHSCTANEGPSARLVMSGSAAAPRELCVRVRGRLRGLRNDVRGTFAGQFIQGRSEGGEGRGQGGLTANVWGRESINATCV